nr:MAG TPA: hypothetical protein [Caudoviricetes sp.]
MWKFPLQIFPSSPEIIPAHLCNWRFTLCFKHSPCHVSLLSHFCIRRFSNGKHCATKLRSCVQIKKKLRPS